MAWPVLEFSFGWSTIFEAICSEVFEADSIELGFVSGSIERVWIFIRFFECNEIINSREIGGEDVV